MTPLPAPRVSKRESWMTRPCSSIMHPSSTRVLIPGVLAENQRRTTGSLFSSQMSS